MRSPLAFFRRFGRNEDGMLTAEAVIIMPMLLWAYLALFVYWDAYRAVNTSQKAAYTLSDMISREMNNVPLTPAYVTGMRNLMKFLVDKDEALKIRVTEVKWSQINNRFEVDWSISPDTAMAALTTATIASYAYRIPAMSDGDRAIIVETELSYHPAFNVGMADTALKQFIVTRLRFQPKLCMTGFTCA